MRDGLTTAEVAAAAAAPGFLHDEEAMALFRAGCAAARLGPLLEIGAYCGKSAVFLGAAARQAGLVVFSVDHHRGSEENQPGQEYHDRSLVDAQGAVDTLACFRRTIAAAGLEEQVVAVVGRSATVAAHWRTPLGLLFIDGGHSREAAFADYWGWSRWLVGGALLVIHDVFPDPADGGRPPYEVYLEALASGGFRDREAVRSLRILERIGEAKHEA